VALVVTDIVEPALVGLGLNVAAAPLGNPLVAPSVTLPANPPTRVTVTVKLVPKPWVTVWLDGVAESEKSGGGTGCTTSVTVVVLVSDPDVPLIVMTDEPVGVEEEVVTVSVDDAPLAELGLKVADDAAGAPLELNATVPVKPPVRLMLTV
jgi:hypothetical protein